LAISHSFARQTPVLGVPTYGADLRRLINIDYSMDPLLDLPLLGGALRVRLAQYHRVRRSRASKPPRYIGMAGCEQFGDRALRVLSASDYHVATLSHRVTIGAVLIDLHRRKLPADEERKVERALLRAFRDRFAGWLLPPVFLDLVEIAAPRRRRDKLIGRLEAIRVTVSPRSVPLDAARDHRDAARVAAFELATSAAQPTDLELATIELFADLMLVQRASVEDVVRAIALVPARCETVTRAFLRLDREDELEYERAIGHVLASRQLATRIALDETEAVGHMVAARVPYHVNGVLDPDARLRAETGHENRTITANATKPASDAKLAPLVSGAHAGATPHLARFGVDLTGLAADGALPDVVGRDEEIDAMIEILCRRNKRNPVLLGPPGTGKTAIVSGLAARLAGGRVPRRVAGTRIVEVQVASILAGTQSIGDIEERVLPLIAEASQNRVILFFDEVHQLVGAGAYKNNDNDMAQLFKPALARGELALIGATTAAEYRHFIGADAALERRFQPLEITEPTPAVTLAILESIRDGIREDSAIEVPDAILEHLARLSDQVLPGRYQPDRAVDLLELVVARAASLDQSLVTMDLVRAALVRLTGYAPDIGPRLESLAAALRVRALMTDGDVSVLVRRLRVTLGGASVLPGRPRAIVLVPDDEDRTVGIAEAIGAELFGSTRRNHHVDLGRILTMDDLNAILGGRSGHRASADSAVQQASRGPGGVLTLTDLGLAAPIVRHVWVDALRTGRLLDAGAAELRLSALVVLLTGVIRAGSTTEAVGFRSGAPTAGYDHRTLDPDLRSIVDVVAQPVAPASGRAVAAWAETVAVPHVVALLQERGLEVAEPELARRLVAALEGNYSLAAVDRWVEYVLLPELLDPGHAPVKPRRRSPR
jgi:hypothetical protein